MTLKDKNKNVTDKIKAYFLDPFILEGDLYDNPDLYKEISWSLKVHLFEFMNPPYVWFYVLSSILEREPVFIQDFLTTLEKKAINKGKRDEVKFIDEIKPLIDHIWFNHNEENRLVKDRNKV